MKKFGIFSLFLILLLVVVSIGCSKSSTPAAPAENPTAVPTGDINATNTAVAATQTYVASLYTSTITPTDVILSATITPTQLIATSTITRTNTPVNTSTITGTATRTATKTTTKTVTATRTPTTAPTGTPVVTFKWVVGLGVGTGNGQLDRPTGLVYNGSGNIIVADTNNSRIQVFSGSTGNYLTQWGVFGTNTAVAGNLNFPQGICIYGTYIYVADTLNDRIVRMAYGGGSEVSWGTFGTGTSQFNAPTGVVSNGVDVFVSDTVNNRIQIFDTAGVYYTTKTAFGAPYQMAWDGSPNFDMYVASGANSWIDRYDNTTEAKSGTIASGDVSGPQGVAVDTATGLVFVADTGNNRIRVYSNTNTFIVGWGTAGTGNSQFNTPKAIALKTIDANTIRVAVSDTLNHRIQEFDYVHQ